MDDREVRRVVTEYSSMIKRISYNYLKQPFDCDDICQTVFMKLLTGDYEFESSEHEKAWLVRTTINACKDFRKIGVAVAACLTLFSVTAFAAGKATGIVSDIYFGGKSSNFEDIGKLEEEAGIDVAAVGLFTNGYSVEEMEVDQSSTTDDEDNKLSTYKGIRIDYVRDGSPELYLSMFPEALYGEDHEEYDSARATETREYDGITVHYNYDEYLSLPEDEEPTDSEREREETDDHFFISIGRDTRQTDYVSGVNFEIDGVSYVLIGFNLDMSPDELFEMAKEIILAR